jgi:hypothetical protein
VTAGFPRVRDEIQQAPAREVAADHDGRFGVFPLIDDSRDIRMIAQPAQHTRLPGAHGLAARHDQAVVGEHIDRHQPVKLPVMRLVDAFIPSPPSRR